MRHEKLIVFDLDDTLVDTSDIYWRARTQFVEALALLGYEPNEVTEIFEEIDARHISMFGFVPERYGTSMVATYNHILEQHGHQPDLDVLRTIDSCGRVILDSIPKLIEDAELLLQWASKRFELVLLSRGEPLLQMKKLEYADLFRYFSEIKIVPDKNADTFRLLIGAAGYSPEMTWVIGDSIRTDINPGIEAGATCILYGYKHHSYHWRQEHGHSAIGPFYKAHTLKEVIDILEFPSSFEMVAPSVTHEKIRA
jgi:putative hydrolase of the HAD superfamily